MSLDPTTIRWTHSSTTGVADRSIDGAIVHRPRDRKDLSPVLRANIPTSNILRWCCDLGAVDEPSVNAAVGHVVAGGLASPRALRAAVDVHARRGRPGVPALRAALDDWELDGKPVDSILEPMMRRVLQRFGLPPARFHAIVAGYEVDFHFPGTPVVLECDGWETHGRNRNQFEFDRERTAVVTAAGFVIVHFTYRQLARQPERVAKRIRANLDRWAPNLTRLITVSGEDVVSGPDTESSPEGGMTRIFPRCGGAVRRLRGAWRSGRRPGGRCRG